MVAIVFSLLFLLGVAAVTVLPAGPRYPSPFQPSSEVVAFLRANSVQVALAAFFHFSAAIPLAIYTATVSSRLRFLGVRAAGVEIAAMGGVLAFASTMVSASAQWALSRPGVGAESALAEALHSLAFASGGPGYTVPIGLLFAGVSVPGLVFGLLPRWVTWLGLVLAALAELSVLALVLPAAVYLIPVVRFAGFASLIAAGFTLPARAVGGRPRSETAP